MKKLELLLTALLVPLDAAMLFLAATAAYSLRFTDAAVGIRKILFQLTFADFANIVIWIIPIWLLIFVANGLYDIDPNKKFAAEIARIFFACTAGLASITIFIFFRGELFNSRFIVLTAWIFAIIFIIAGRLFVRIIKLICYYSGIGTRRVILIGSGAITDRLSSLLASQKNLGYTIVGRYPIFNEAVRTEIMRHHKQGAIDEIMLTNPKASAEETLALLSFAEEHHFIFKYSADLFATCAPNMQMFAIAEIPIIEFRRIRLEGWGKIYKRIFDIITSALLCIVAAPFMTVITFAIYFETGLPIIFKNKRVGYKGAAFDTFKFRSMRQRYCIGPQFTHITEALQLEKKLIETSNTKNGPVYKIQNDPRVTWVGKFIRRWSLDELPQLWNVIIGTMSLVGPRPHQPREVAKYSPEHRRVHSVKPGITGLAQISGRSDLSFEEEIRLDTFYIENWSLTTDLFILLKTPWAVLRRRRAE